MFTNRKATHTNCALTPTNHLVSPTNNLVRLTGRLVILTNNVVLLLAVCTCYFSLPPTSAIVFPQPISEEWTRKQTIYFCWTLLYEKENMTISLAIGVSVSLLAYRIETH